MKILLLGGAESVGKTNAIYKLANRLRFNRYRIVAGNIPETVTDFRVVLENTKTKKKIIINSITDTPKFIKVFKTFFDENPNCDIMISSVRDAGYRPRREFFEIMQIEDNSENILEIPLAKITRRNNTQNSIQWYADRIDRVIDTILNNNPYNI